MMGQSGSGIQQPAGAWQPSGGIVNRLARFLVVGPITSMPHCSASLPQQYGYGFNEDQSWITYDGVNVVWLPAEYQPASTSIFAMSAATMATGSTLGRAIFLSLSEHNRVKASQDHPQFADRYQLRQRSALHDHFPQLNCF